MNKPEGCPEFLDFDNPVCQECFEKDECLQRAMYKMMSSQLQQRQQQIQRQQGKVTWKEIFQDSTIDRFVTHYKAFRQRLLDAELVSEAIPLFEMFIRVGGGFSSRIWNTMAEPIEGDEE